MRRTAGGWSTQPAPSPSPLGRCLTAPEAAVYLGVHLTMLRRLIRRHELPALRHNNGRLIGVYQTHIDSWRTAHLETPDTTTRAGDDRIAQFLPATLHFPI